MDRVVCWGAGLGVGGGKDQGGIDCRPAGVNLEINTIAGRLSINET